MASDEQVTCSVCDAVLFEPYIKCSECTESDVLLCLYCFAKGREKQSHRNSHKYEVMKSDFSVLEAGWTAADEIRLIDALTHCGVGNWKDVARKVKKSPAECRRHYERVYIDNNKGQFEQLDDRSGESRLCPVVLKVGEAPPRPPEGSTLQHDMSGYIPARGDFAVEFDNFAEINLAPIYFNKDEDTDEETELENESKDGGVGPLLTSYHGEGTAKLKMAMLDIYWRVIKERHRRKQLVRDYGLINFRRHFIYDKKYYKTLGANILDTLRGFGRHMPAIEWDKMVESYHRESQLRKEIMELCECRREGITRLISAGIYKQLKKRREHEKQSRHLLDDAIALLQKEQWMSKQTLLGNIIKGVPNVLPPLAKKEIKPLDIVGLPNYDKLSEKEKQFCSTVRILPDQFMEYRRVLISENNKTGHVKLGTARVLLKIDVNKTRKMFDFLADEGHIVKEICSKRKVVDTGNC